MDSLKKTLENMVLEIRNSLRGNYKKRMQTGDEKRPFLKPRGIGRSGASAFYSGKIQRRVTRRPSAALAPIAKAWFKAEAHKSARGNGHQLLLYLSRLFASSTFTAFCAPLLVCLAYASAPQSLAAPEHRVALNTLAARLGLDAPVRNALRATLGSVRRASFELDSRRFFFDGTLIWLNAKCVAHGGDWAITECDAVNIVVPLLYPANALVTRRIQTVVIDPGHGGMDTGATDRHGILEKEIVLDIARRVRSKLEACGIDVRLTRSKDQELQLQERIDLARKFTADILVSVHLNSASNGDARGVETYALPGEGFPSTSSTRGAYSRCVGNHHDAANTLLAYYVHRGVLFQTGAQDRGLKRARFELLRDAPCPAALIECGFVSNRTEAALLMDSAYRDAIAEGITRGILTFISKTNG